MSAPSDAAPSDAGGAAGPGPAASFPVWHYDGVTALRRRAGLVVEGDAFRLVEPDRTTGPFAFADLVAPEGARDDASFRLKRRPGWRIGFPGGVPAAVAAHLPGRARYGGIVDRFGLWRSSLVFSVLAALAVVLVLRTPALVARLVPASVEQRLGQVMIGDFGANGCSTPAGDAALAALLRRIDPNDPRLDLHVVKLPMVNAVTLPGGRIVVFSGLLDAARAPDALAGVVGHEIGHVRHRDVMEALLRQLGLSVLLGGLEGHVGGYTNALLATAYSRDAEYRADGYAITLMQEAKVSPLPTAAFFDQLGRRGAGAERMLAYVASHPVSADRAARFRRSVATRAAYAPTLDDAQWRALKTICAGSRDVGRTWNF